jgi:hypothetical protein
MTLITCIGEALIDFLPLPGDGRTAGFGMHAGGSSLNVAVAAARLGRTTSDAICARTWRRRAWTCGGSSQRIHPPR